MIFLHSAVCSLIQIREAPPPAIIFFKIFHYLISDNKELEKKLKNQKNKSIIFLNNITSFVSWIKS